MRGTRGTAAGALVAIVLTGCGSAEQAGAEAATGDAADKQDTAADEPEDAADEPPHPGPIAPEQGPYEPQAEVRPDLMEVHPGEAAPGENVELRFPRGTDRGVGFVLEELVDDSWEVRYFLTVPDIGPGDDPPEDLQGSWFPPDNPDRLDWPDVGVHGTIPGRVLIPEPAEPGEYRICTAMQPEPFCAELSITP